MSGMDAVEQAYAELAVCVQEGARPETWLQASNRLERALADLPPPSNHDDLRFLQNALRRHRDLLHELKDQLKIKGNAVRQQTRVRQRYQVDSAQPKFVDRQS